jgi:hypothetical protein
LCATRFGRARAWPGHRTPPAKATFRGRRTTGSFPTTAHRTVRRFPIPSQIPSSLQFNSERGHATLSESASSHQSPRSAPLPCSSALPLQPAPAPWPPRQHPPPPRCFQGPSPARRVTAPRRPPHPHLAGGGASAASGNKRARTLSPSPLSSLARSLARCAGRRSLGVRPVAYSTPPCEARADRSGHPAAGLGVTGSRILADFCW